MAALATLGLGTSLPLYAMRLETQVRLKGLDRSLVITHDEPGEPDTLSLSLAEGDKTFKLETFNLEAGIITSSREFRDDEGKRKLETANLFLDPNLLARFKRMPEWSALGMGFVNSKEVTCPPQSNAVLRYQPTYAPRQTLGNCVTLPLHE